jgi:hypothetical protein
MNDCLVVLYWPDFARFPAAYPSAGLVAHSLRRYVCALHDDLHGAVWADVPADAAAFAARGFTPHPGSPQVEDVLALAQRHPDARLVTAMAPSRAAQLAAPLSQAGIQVEVWPPERPDEQDLSLADLLHLRTSLPLGLIVDAPELPVSAAEKALRWSEVVGAPVIALNRQADGAWSDLLSHAGAAQGGSSLQILRGEAWLRLHTWILVGDGDWVSDAIRWGHAHEIRVLVWSPDERHASSATAAMADGFCALAELPELRRPAPSPFAGSAGVQADVRIETHTLTRPASAARESESDGSHGASPHGGLDASRLGPWVRLMYHFECIQRQRGWSRGPMREVAESLAVIDEFGPTPANASLWLNRAKVEGLVHIEGDAAGGSAVCRANLDHPVCRASVEIPDRCLRLLYQMLQKIPWVSFKLLRSVLLREQWLGGPPYRLDEPTIDEWLNFLIHHGAIRMTKEPNLVNPDYPVTALRLNGDHPLSHGVVSDASESTRLGAERAILAVDHFLTRNRKPWMAMGALRRALDGMGRDELQSVLQGLQNLGALITESYPNPQKEHFTTGCRLKTDEPMVARALQVRNRIIQATQRHARERTWVPLARVSESLDGHAEIGSPAQRTAWLLLLRDEGILELDQENLVPGQSWEDIRCRLNVSDAVVRAVIAERSDGGSAYPDYD